MYTPAKYDMRHHRTPRVSMHWVHSHTPSIRSHRETQVVFPDFQPMRVAEEPVCINLFRKNTGFTSLHWDLPFMSYRLCSRRLNYDTRHHGEKLWGSTRSLLNLIRGIKEKHKSPLYCTRMLQNMIRGIIWNHEDPMYTRAHAQYDTRHHGKSRESTRWLLNLIRLIKRKSQESTVLYKQNAEYVLRF